MDNPMSMHDELAGLAAKATPGPWVFDGDWSRRPCINAGPKEIAQIYKKGFPARDDHRPDEAANAALIIALRNNLPAILSALNAADEVKRLRKALGNIGNLSLNGCIKVNTMYGERVGTPDAYAREVLGMPWRTEDPDYSNEVMENWSD